VVEALNKVVHCVRDEMGFLAHDIFLLGRSIGTGISISYASENEVGGLVLVSPFTSIKAVVEHGGGYFTNLGPFGKHFITERLNSLAAIPDIRCPTLFVHGTLDNIVPVEHSAQLMEASGADKKQFKCFVSMDHDNVFDEQHLPVVIDAMRNVLPLSKDAEPKEVFVQDGVLQRHVQTIQGRSCLVDSVDEEKINKLEQELTRAEHKLEIRSSAENEQAVQKVMHFNLFNYT